MALPVLLLSAGAAPEAVARTLASLGSQTVRVSVHTDQRALAGLTSEHVGLVVAGATLDATACERAAWFLSTHPGVPCVTGAAAGTPAGAPAPDLLSAALQFVVGRRELVQQLLATLPALHPSTALAFLIGARGTCGRGAGWLTEPVLRGAVDAAVCATLVSQAREALPQLGLTEAALFDHAAGGLPAHPLQRLMRTEAPAVTVVRAPSRGGGVRLLALLQGFPMGGYTVFNTELLPRLAEAGHVVTTCTTEWWRSDWRLEQVRAVAPDIHHPHAAVPAAAVPAYIDWLITTRGIEVVLLSHSLLGFHALPWLRARHPEVAFVDFVHTDWFEQAMYGSYATLATLFEGQLDAQLATSDTLASQLVAGGCPRDGVRTAHIGIDTALWRHDGDRLAVVRESFGAGPETLVLLFAGRIAPEKRPHLAVEVAAALRDDGRDVVLVFAGEGPELRRVHERAAALGLLPRCHFLGELDEHTLRHVYAAADVFLAPSEIEGISRSLYEAMAMGCVPVVSDVGGQRELVVPGTGSLVDAGGSGAAPYVEGVRPWLDRTARGAARVAARAHVVNRFDITRTVSVVTEALALARRRRAERQAVLPVAMGEALAVQALETIRRHVLRSMGR
ncbi:MAG: glycosyltransferase family 4 protein [Gemmatimonadaceae bacterium]|nr:glycosyltransferase family 4 protein [Gemmatimonadaceae bacterium]